MLSYNRLSLVIGLCAVCSTGLTQDNDGPVRIAFLAGVSEYRHKDMDDLDYSENDVTELERELVNLGFEVESTRGAKATKDNIEAKLKTFVHRAKTLSKNDIVFLAFSGHGQQLQVDGELVPFFCPYDAIPLRDIESRIKTMISLNWVLHELEESGSLHNLVAIDACRNNPAKGRGVDGGFAEKIPRGVSILFSAKSGQKSWESTDENIKHGVFTHFLLQGLRGEGRDRRGRLTWDSLVAYVRSEVPTAGPAIAGGSERRQDPHFVSNQDTLTVLSLSSNTRPPPPTPMPVRRGGFAGQQAGETRTDNGLKMTLVWCPPGNFKMGSPLGEPGRGRDEQQQAMPVAVGFWIGQTEVTQGQWKTVMDSEPWLGETSSPSDASIAANFVSWREADLFCRQFTHQEREAERIPDDWAYRLPTESQWEYACRAGRDTAYSFGNNASELAQYANFGQSQFNGAVKQKKPNSWGVFDIHGNVSEWSRDVYVERYNSKRDVILPDEDTKRSLRGGAWTLPARYCRSASRDAFFPDSGGKNFGLRIVLEAN